MLRAPQAPCLSRLGHWSRQADQHYHRVCWPCFSVFCCRIRTESRRIWGDTFSSYWAVSAATSAHQSRRSCWHHRVLYEHAVHDGFDSRFGMAGVAAGTPTVVCSYCSWTPRACRLRQCLCCRALITSNPFESATVGLLYWSRRACDRN